MGLTSIRAITRVQDADDVTAPGSGNVGQVLYVSAYSGGAATIGYMAVSTPTLDAVLGAGATTTRNLSGGSAGFSGQLSSGTLNVSGGATVGGVMNAASRLTVGGAVDDGSTALQLAGTISGFSNLQGVSGFQIGAGGYTGIASFSGGGVQVGGLNLARNTGAITSTAGATFSGNVSAGVLTGAYNGSTGVFSGNLTSTLGNLSIGTNRAGGGSFYFAQRSNGQASGTLWDTGLAAFNATLRISENGQSNYLEVRPSYGMSMIGTRPLALNLQLTDTAPTTGGVAIYNSSSASTWTIDNSGNTNQSGGATFGGDCALSGHYLHLSTLADYNYKVWAGGGVSILEGYNGVQLWKANGGEIVVATFGTSGTLNSTFAGSITPGSINTATTPGTAAGQIVYDASAGANAGHAYVWNGSSWLKLDN